MLAVTQEFAGIEGLLDRNHPAFRSFAMQLFYVCCAVAMLGGCLLLTLGWYRLSGWLRMSLQVLIVTGSMALPIYVFHGQVIPLKEMLVALGLPGAVALALPMGAFLLGVGYGGRHLYQMYFGRSAA